MHTPSRLDASPCRYRGADTIDPETGQPLFTPQINPVSVSVAEARRLRGDAVDESLAPASPSDRHGTGTEDVGNALYRAAVRKKQRQEIAERMKLKEERREAAQARTNEASNAYVDPSRGTDSSMPFPRPPTARHTHAHAHGRPTLAATSAGVHGGRRGPCCTGCTVVIMGAMVETHRQPRWCTTAPSTHPRPFEVGSLCPSR